MKISAYYLLFPFTLFYIDNVRLLFQGGATNNSWVWLFINSDFNYLDNPEGWALVAEYNIRMHDLSDCHMEMQLFVYSAYLTWRRNHA